jgi:SAM-dependent MidA family methyltransferase
VHFVETSPMLREEQAERVPGASWHESIDYLPKVPMLLVANEFFDALPIQQFADGIARKIIVAGGGLAFDRDGDIVERSPARKQASAAIARHLAEHGGVALIVDYGHERSAAGDTLQAVRGHRYAAVLANPGEQDLTSHVDFEALGHSARDEGTSVTRLATQGEWLNRLGIGARAAALAGTNPERAKELASAVHRLTARDEMGQLFKVMSIHSPDWPRPAGFAS